jgi:uncharacterized protein (DUF169 family)
MPMSRRCARQAGSRPKQWRTSRSYATSRQASFYGPLRDIPVEPSVILLRLNGKQQMLLHDAWPSLRFEGKPQCHIIAIAKEIGEIAVSLGCMLSRVRTGMSNNEVTCAIPTRHVSALIERLRAARAAADAVAAYAAEDSKRFPRQ